MHSTTIGCRKADECASAGQKTVETKTRNYDRDQLMRVHQQAAWLSRRRRRWARNGELAVMCLVNPRGVERVEDDVLVVSIDGLTRVLRVAAAMAPTRTR
jgi:hypothetical protein